MTVHLVGAGPGDPGLITARGLELVRSCDVLVHDAGANELQPAGGDLPRVARAGADEMDGHESARSTRRSKYALRSS